MKKIFCTILLVLDVLSFLILGFLSQFLIKVDDVTGLVTDGFGRILSDTPYLLQKVGLYEWAGIKWFIIDSICGWAMIAIAYFLFTAIWGNKDDV